MKNYGKYGRKENAKLGSCASNESDASLKLWQINADSLSLRDSRGSPQRSSHLHPPRRRCRPPPRSERAVGALMEMEGSGITAEVGGVGGEKER